METGWIGSVITVEDGQKKEKKNLGEHKVITPKQQFLGIIIGF